MEMVMLEEGEEARALVERLIDTEDRRRRGDSSPAPVQPETASPEVTVEESLDNMEIVLNPGLQPVTEAPTLDDLASLFPDTTISPDLASLFPDTFISPGMETTEEMLTCRFPYCGSTLGGTSGTASQMKLHYAGQHFQLWFPMNTETNLLQGFNRTGSRIVCCKCTETAGKPVYVQGEENAARGHLAIHHDSLGEILLQATEVPEARDVISDLYPELLEWTASP